MLSDIKIEDDIYLDLKISKEKNILTCILYNYFGRVQGSTPNQKGNIQLIVIAYTYSDRVQGSIPNLWKIKIPNLKIKTKTENYNYDKKLKAKTKNKTKN